MDVVLEELLKLEDAAVGLNHGFADHIRLFHYSLPYDLLSGQHRLAPVLSIHLPELREILSKLMKEVLFGVIGLGPEDGMKKPFIVRVGLGEGLPQLKGNAFFLVTIAIFVESDVLLDSGDKVFLEVMEDGLFSPFPLPDRDNGLLRLRLRTFRFLLALFLALAGEVLNSL